MDHFGQRFGEIFGLAAEEACNARPDHDRHIAAAELAAISPWLGKIAIGAKTPPFDLAGGFASPGDTVVGGAIADPNGKQVSGSHRIIWQSVVPNLMDHALQRHVIVILAQAVRKGTG